MTRTRKAATRKRGRRVRPGRAKVAASLEANEALWKRFQGSLKGVKWDRSWTRTRDRY